MSIFIYLSLWTLEIFWNHICQFFNYYFCFQREDWTGGRYSFFKFYVLLHCFLFLPSSMSCSSIYKHSRRVDIVIPWSLSLALMCSVPGPPLRTRGLALGCQPFLFYRHPHSCSAPVPSFTKRSPPVQASKSQLQTHLLYPDSPAKPPQGTGVSPSARWSGPDNTLPLCLDRTLLEEDSPHITYCMVGYMLGAQWSSKILNLSVPWFPCLQAGI